jgi:hypothetical protein
MNCAVTTCPFHLVCLTHEPYVTLRGRRARYRYGKMIVVRCSNCNRIQLTVIGMGAQGLRTEKLTYLGRGDIPQGCRIVARRSGIWASDYCEECDSVTAYL